MTNTSSHNVSLKQSTQTHMCTHTTLNIYIYTIHNHSLAQHTPPAGPPCLGDTLQDSTHTHTHTHTHRPARTQRHPHTQRHTDTHTHTHTHTHTLSHTQLNSAHLCQVQLVEGGSGDW